MFSKTAQLACLCMVGLAGLSGCTTGARYVTVNNSGGVVAIPSNTNEWPNYYRKQAEDLMQARCPGGYVVEQQEPFTLSTQRSTTSKGDPMQAAPPGTPMVQNSRDANNFSNNAEWRIYFRRIDAPEGAALALKAPPQTEAAQAFPVQRGLTLTPTGTTLPTLPTPLIVAPNLMQGGPTNSGRYGMPD